MGEGGRTYVGNNYIVTVEVNRAYDDGRKGFVSKRKMRNHCYFKSEVIKGISITIQLN